MRKRLGMNQIISKLGAMMLIGVLVTSVGTTQVFADWDKTVYPAIQGTIPIIDGEDYTTKNQISLVEAMTIAENILPNSKALYGKLTTVNDYLVYKIFMVNNDREHNKILVDAGSGDELYVSEVITKDYYKKKHSKDKSYNKKMNDYFKGMTSEQIAEKKKQFNEMGDAWKSISLQDRAFMILHFMQMKIQWETMSDDEKAVKKTEMKKQWEEYLTMSLEEKKQKLTDYIHSLRN